MRDRSGLQGSVATHAQAASVRSGHMVRRQRDSMQLGWAHTCSTTEFFSFRFLPRCCRSAANSSWLIAHFSIPVMDRITTCAHSRLHLLIRSHLRRACDGKHIAAARVGSAHTHLARASNRRR
jgi:hypothetical protein